MRQRLQKSLLHDVQRVVRVADDRQRQVVHAILILARQFAKSVFVAGQSRVDQSFVVHIRSCNVGRVKTAFVPKVSRRPPVFFKISSPTAVAASQNR
jgi:hypothetical protein